MFLIGIFSNRKEMVCNIWENTLLPITVLLSNPRSNGAQPANEHWPPTAHHQSNGILNEMFTFGNDHCSNTTKRMKKSQNIWRHCWLTPLEKKPFHIFNISIWTAFVHCAALFKFRFGNKRTESYLTLAKMPYMPRDHWLRLFFLRHVNLRFLCEIKLIQPIWKTLLIRIDQVVTQTVGKICLSVGRMMIVSMISVVNFSSNSQFKYEWRLFLKL